MLGIISAIKEFFEFIVNLVKFLIQLIKDLIMAIDMLKDVVVKLPDYLNFLPSTVVALFVACLSVVIVYKVLGRD